ncbi:MAG: DegT/DnrJ/EryC1/StrS family aminotransferase [Kiritimatiellae bacterium]|nr:DegT/DnrJ/EryC1/StrS family aminotransferase [Kiritimatiellia bacterium]
MWAADLSPLSISMKSFEQPILVTRPYLPPLEDFKRGCEEIWGNRWLSNNGPMVRRFQAALAEYLQVPETRLALFCNGTLALEMGFKAMGLEGAEVITTPFTFVATAHALFRIGARPVFADIDPETLCLSPEAAEKLITPRTKAIVPVHVYGNACDTAGFDRLADKYGLKIIYDAAHAFGTDLHRYGDMSMFSFHPTKLFHSAEGGLLVFKDAPLQQKLFELRNFAIHSETECTAVGTNAKMNEFQALMGLLCLEKLDDLLAHRRLIHDTYAAAFADCPDIRLLSHSQNRAYIPVLFKDFATRERVYSGLREKCNVFARRYFYPLLTDFPPYAYAKNTCPVAQDLASRVLTLPTYHGLATNDVLDIAEKVKELL